MAMLRWEQMTKPQQTATATPNGQDSKVTFIPFEMLTPPQQEWVDYNVVQGVIVESDGEMHKLTVAEFANKLGVDRVTCYRWSKAIPNFWDLVSERRRVLFSGARTAKVWNAVFLAATVKLNVQAQALWLANADSNFRMPNQTVTHEAGGGLMDVLEIARQRKMKQTPNVIEAEIIDAATEPVQQ